MLCERCQAEITEGGEGFESFWAAYPLKRERLASQRAWKRLTKAEQLAVMNDLPRRIATWSLPGQPQNGSERGTFKPFAPNPPTYLNGKRWQDEFTVVVKPAAVNGGLAARPVSEVIDPDLLQTPEQRRANMGRLGSIMEGIGKRL